VLLRSFLMNRIFASFVLPIMASCGQMNKTLAPIPSYAIYKKPNKTLQLMRKSSAKKHAERFRTTELKWQAHPMVPMSNSFIKATGQFWKLIAALVPLGAVGAILIYQEWFSNKVTVFAGRLLPFSAIAA
jgi:hypothetical protein